MPEPEIESRVVGGRGLVTSGDGEERIASWPEVAYEAIRSINHLTSGSECVPAPTLYEVLGNLKMVGHLLPQAFEQLGAGLERSLAELDVYDGRGDPAASVATAQELLTTAARAAGGVGALLELAQSAIAEQGYHTTEEVTTASPSRRPTEVPGNGHQVQLAPRW